jgi:hypothetical protein
MPRFSLEFLARGAENFVKKDSSMTRGGDALLRVYVFLPFACHFTTVE